MCRSTGLGRGSGLEAPSLLSFYMGIVGEAGKVVFVAAEKVLRGGVGGEGVRLKSSTPCCCHETIVPPTRCCHETLVPANTEGCTHNLVEVTLTRLPLTEFTQSDKDILAILVLSGELLQNQHTLVLMTLPRILSLLEDGSCEGKGGRGKGGEGAKWARTFDTVWH